MTPRINAGPITDVSNQNVFTEPSFTANAKKEITPIPRMIATPPRYGTGSL